MSAEKCGDAAPEKVEKTAELINLNVKQMMENNYENVEIPTFQRYIN
jgi:hypothetical protein